MVDDRESASAGWREVYREMEVDPGVEAPTARCPDCGRPCENVARDVYDCGEHGLFRASGSGGRGADDEDKDAGDDATKEEHDEVSTKLPGYRPARCLPAPSRR